MDVYEQYLLSELEKHRAQKQGKDVSTSEKMKYWQDLAEKYKRNEVDVSVDKEKLNEIKSKISDIYGQRGPSMDKQSYEYKILEFCHNHDIMALLKEEFERNPIDYTKAQKEWENDIMSGQKR